MTAPAFLTEPPPPYGTALPVATGIRRIVANNPGPMTYHGTNTYLIEDGAGFVVVDPGPDDTAHVSAVLAATGGAVTRILLSHGHADHAGALPALAAATGAPVFAGSRQFGQELRDGEAVVGWTALATPGHAPDHLCFAHDGVVFSGDHVMSFATSVVSPPDGDMAAYITGLRRMLARDDRLYLPGHGPPIPTPRPFVAALLAHRLAREDSIRAHLHRAPTSVAAIADALYPSLDSRLRGAAEASVLAHLQKLQAEGRAEETAGLWREPPTL